MDADRTLVEVVDNVGLAGDKVADLADVDGVADDALGNAQTSLTLHSLLPRFFGARPNVPGAGEMS